MLNVHFNTGSSETPTYYEHLLMTSNLLSISGLLGGSSGGLAPSGRPWKRTPVKSVKSTEVALGLAARRL